VSMSGSSSMTRIFAAAVTCCLLPGSRFYAAGR
jgi:hypothetical protein